MRIAVLLRDRCHPKKCSMECINYCPKVRTGDETVVVGDKGKPIISEELCVGCGICIHKCPFDAIKIIGLPEGVEDDLVHQFGLNGFRLFRLPIPKSGNVIGLLGPNGIGKTTAINILAGELIPNLGNYEKEPDWEVVLDKFSGTELSDYFKKVIDGGFVATIKPQYVDKLSMVYKGKVFELLAKVGPDTDRLDSLVNEMELKNILDHDITELSGGELQRIAIAATMLKEADIYFFDEPSSYLDIFQRLKIAKQIRNMAQDKQVVVIEHDLAVLDFLADTVHIYYGSDGAYGISSHPHNVRNAINTYLNGYIRDENVRFRDREIKFELHPPRVEWRSEPLLEFEPLRKKLNGFSLDTKKGLIHEGEVVGIVGPNSTGKTTFVKLLAGVIEPSEGKIEIKIRVSYKPQYIKTDFNGTVRELYYTELGEAMESKFYMAEIEAPLNLETLYDQPLDTLSGGELQRASIGLALTQEADIYLIDEPSAYLDSNQRMEVARTIRRVMEKSGTSALVVDHDVYFIDLVSDSIMVFMGEPSIQGYAEGPFDLRTGMNKFLKEVEITFRRDTDTHRPRINKADSRLDREQKSKGEYYYA